MMTHFITCDHLHCTGVQEGCSRTQPRPPCVWREVHSRPNVLHCIWAGGPSPPVGLHKYLSSPEGVTRQLTHSSCNPFRQWPPRDVASYTSPKDYMTTTHPPSCVEDFVYGYIYVQVHVRDLLILAKDLPTLISNGTSRQLLKCVNSCDPDQCQQISDTDDLPSHSGGQRHSDNKRVHTRPNCPDSSCH